MKKLFLTSDTVTENLVKDFEDLMGKSINGLKVAFIPDAGYAPSLGDKRSSIRKERQALVDLYNWKITDMVLGDSNPDSLKILFDQDVVYINGGLSGYLAKMMRQSGFEEALPELLEKGVVYVGSSAGSMVLSDIQDASSWYLNAPEPEAINILGLGYIDFQIYPHVQDEQREKLLKIVKKDLFTTL
jgi:dipeptidase E